MGKIKFAWVIVVFIFVFILALPIAGKETSTGESIQTKTGNSGISTLDETNNSGGELIAGMTERVSVNSSGEQGNGESLRPAISGDGRYVAFWSEASNLVSGDTNDTRDIFVHDREMGQTKRVSVASDGSQGNNGSGNYVTSISSDGRYVAFESYASNLVLDDTNNRGDIFVHDQQTGQTMLISVATDGTQGNVDSYWPSLSADGRYVSFWSSASNLVSNDTNGFMDVYVHNRQTGQTDRASIASDGTQGDSHSWMPSISGDGRYVAFASSSNNLVPNDPSSEDIFVHDMQTGQTERVSVASDGTQADNSSERPSISTNGQFVAFQSWASNLVDGDDNEYVDIFMHDRDTGITKIVSIASDGTKGNGVSGIPSISADGRFVAFSSMASNLVSGDTNSTGVIFLHDRQTAQTELISLSSDRIQGNNGGWVPAISSDGQYVAFDSSSSNLVCGDTNNKHDIFVRHRSGIVELSSVSGIITSPEMKPIPNVTISDSEGHDTTTNVNGYYQLDRLIPCTYTITPSLDDYIFTPTSMQITVPPNIESRDFSGVRRLYSFLPSITRNYCGLSYNDDFSDPQSGWPIFQNEHNLYEYLNGEYHILVKQTKWWAAASPDYRAENFIAGVEVRTLNNVYGTYGILFGLAEDWSHFYSFEIDSDGYYGIWRYSDTEGWKLLTVNNSPYINKATAVNHLKVKRDGALIEVFANNYLLSTITDGTFMGMDYLGLIATNVDQPYLNVYYDNFFVTSIACNESRLLKKTQLQLQGVSSPHQQIMSQENDKQLR